MADAWLSDMYQIWCYHCTLEEWRMLGFWDSEKDAKERVASWQRNNEDNGTSRMYRYSIVKVVTV